MADLSNINHVVVVMLENRSFDNMLGWLYADEGTEPKAFLPPTNASPYDGLNDRLWNPSNEDFFEGKPADKVPIGHSAPGMTTPDIDPEEQFHYVTEQIYGPNDQPSATPEFPMLGFVVDYRRKAEVGEWQQIMKPYSPEQLPVLSALARSYAVSDAWFCSVPSQTLPNRSFVHAGTSNGNVDNGTLPNPLDWDVKTIFNVLEEMNVAWRVYSDTDIVPSLTRTLNPQLWPRDFDDRFRSFDRFKEECAAGSLPSYSFIEPSFFFFPNDQHPPHGVAAGERFLHAIWRAVSRSPAWGKTLLIITYDEHGGTYDHVLPPWGAVCPDGQSNPGKEGFRFDRFGVRVPMVVVSPWIQAGTVFRTDTKVPYDHTSILATLRDWLKIPADKMLPSTRIANAPTLAQLITLSSPRTDEPSVSASIAAGFEVLGEEILDTLEDREMNDLQAGLVSAAAVRMSKNPAVVRDKVRTRNDARDFFAGLEQGHR